MTRLLFPGMVALGISAFIAASLATTSATQIKSDDIAGTVTSTAGPEAGVWGIAETKDLPTLYIKEVVTDDQGRYLIPALPKAGRERKFWRPSNAPMPCPSSNAHPATLAASCPAASARWWICSRCC